MNLKNSSTLLFFRVVLLFIPDGKWLLFFGVHIILFLYEMYYYLLALIEVLSLSDTIIRKVV